MSIANSHVAVHIMHSTHPGFVSVLSIIIEQVTINAQQSYFLQYLHSAGAEKPDAAIVI